MKKKAKLEVGSTKVSGPVTIRNCNFHADPPVPPTADVIATVRVIADACLVNARALHEATLRLTTAPQAPMLQITGNRLD